MNSKLILRYLHFGYFLLLLSVPISATFVADATHKEWSNQYVWNFFDYATVFLPCMLIWVVVPSLTGKVVRRMLMILSCMLAGAATAFFVTMMVFPLPIRNWDPKLGFYLIPGLFLLTIWLTVKNWRVEN
ncbi:hypothetical protein [Lewinella sp. W8]|uniref:hypothetical protein n=1 Tax=Lewinella sp. W8 TaxID=2528208 RepID=UPI001068221B|nr:hypothetical protein [Lewinella sp. W8]MTB51928.1 hypothetical protein [Lewinella sp. W8]